MNKAIFILIFFTSIVTFSHKGENHSEESEDGREAVKETVSDETLQKINSSYLEQIKPIFKSKCLDCHGSGNSLPWYANIPGPKDLIQNDIEEAKKHMDMTNDFPFSGHGKPVDDLKAIEKTVKEEAMPPLRYKILHWSSSLTEDEKKAVVKWVVDSLNVLNQSDEDEE